MTRSVVSIVLLLLLASPVFAAAARDWQTGTVLEMEQEKVPSGSISHSNTDVTAKDKGNNKTQYSGNRTTTTTQDYDTFQIYTVQHGSKVYTAREQLLFPWSKPANLSVGENVKMVVDKNRMYLLDDDGKEHKAKITKVKMKSAD